VGGTKETGVYQTREKLAPLWGVEWRERRSRYKQRRKRSRNQEKLVRGSGRTRTPAQGDDVGETANASEEKIGQPRGPFAAIGVLERGAPTRSGFEQKEKNREKDR